MAKLIAMVSILFGIVGIFGTRDLYYEGQSWDIIIIGMIMSAIMIVFGGVMWGV